MLVILRALSLSRALRAHVLSFVCDIYCQIYYASPLPLSFHTNTILPPISLDPRYFCILFLHDDTSGASDFLTSTTTATVTTLLSAARARPQWGGAQLRQLLPSQKRQLAPHQHAEEGGWGLQRREGAGQGGVWLVVGGWGRLYLVCEVVPSLPIAVLVLRDEQLAEQGLSGFRCRRVGWARRSARPGPDLLGSSAKEH